MTAKPVAFRLAAAGLSLAGERIGDDPADIVLFLHGGGQTRHSWKSTGIRTAHGGRTAILLDARGHGDSDWHPGGDYRLDGFVADLLECLATLNQPPVIVGASLGGITALVAAGENPGVARGLVLVDVVAALERPGARRIREFMTSAPHGFASLNEVADAIAAYNPLRPRPPTLDGLQKNVRRRADGRWYWHWDPAFIDIGDESHRRSPPERLRSAARALTVPTLIVRGAQSDVVSATGVADMLTLIPHAQAVDVPAAGHMVAGDDNDVFSAELERFLSVHAPPQGRVRSS